jgi:hypothetical protein
LATVNRDRLSFDTQRVTAIGGKLRNYEDHLIAREKVSRLGSDRLRAAQSACTTRSQCE